MGQILPTPRSRRRRDALIVGGTRHGFIRLLLLWLANTLNSNGARSEGNKWKQTQCKENNYVLIFIFLQQQQQPQSCPRVCAADIAADIARLTLDIRNSIDTMPAPDSAPRGAISPTGECLPLAGSLVPDAIHFASGLEASCLPSSVLPI